MIRTITERLAKVSKAIEALPKESQEAVLDEITEHVEGYSTSLLSAAQRAEIKRRLAAPRKYMTAAQTRAMFREFNPSL